MVTATKKFPRRIIFFIPLVFILIAVKAYAIELGSMTIFSTPEENFQAEIEVLGLNGLDESDIDVSIPDENVFREVGLIYASYLEDMHVLFLAITNNKGIIKISSSFPLNDNMIMLLINLKWYGGSITREYVTEINRSSATGNNTSTTSPAKIEIPEEKNTITPLPPADNDNKHTPQTKSDKPTSKPKESKLSISRISIDIVSGDTLKNIAENIKLAFFRNDDDITLEQIMVSLLQDQPEAFQQSSNNLADFRTGASIVLPQYNEISRYNQQFAENTINKLSNKRSAKPEQTIKTPKPPKQEISVRVSKKSEKKPEKKSRERVQLSTDKTDSTEARLAANLEELDKLKRQSDELKLRLQNLQQQLEDSQRLLALKNQQLEALKTNLEQARQEALAREQKSLFDIYINTPIFWISLAIALFMLIIILRAMPVVFSNRKQRQKSIQQKTENEPGNPKIQNIQTAPLYTYKPAQSSRVQASTTNNQYTDTPETADTPSTESSTKAETGKTNKKKAEATEINAKLDLAKAYAGMNATDEARTLLADVLDQGSEEQIKQAHKILEQIENSPE